MIKKIVKSEKFKKILLVILMITTMSTINPVVSNAGIGASLLTKPICAFGMAVLDCVNGVLAALFAFDEKIDSVPEDTIEEITAIKEEESSKNIFEKIVEGLDEGVEGLCNLLLSPEDIFSGKVQITNANIFSSKFEEDGNFSLSDSNLFNHLMKQIKQGTASLYYITRNLAVVILLSLLIYTGIRIVMASNNVGEKAKWKEYLYDWLKALALVMFVELIMIGIFYICEVVTQGLTESFGGDSIVTYIRKNFNKTSIFDFVGSILYLIMYAYVTYMTIVFLLAYFKRLFYIIVMVIVAPVVSALYALGKAGKDSFNRWLKEFIMGVMVQPFQLLIYSVLFLIPMKVMTSSGIEVSIGGTTIAQYATLDTQIFALIAMSMIRPIEKFMRNIFGFTGTALDNVASFESGKKTLDKGAQLAVTGVKTAAMVGSAVATGGGSLVSSAFNFARGSIGQQSTPDFLQDTHLGDVMDNPAGGIGTEEEKEHKPLSEIMKNPTGGIEDNTLEEAQYDAAQKIPDSLKGTALGKVMENPTGGIDDNKTNANIVLDNANVQINSAKGLEIGNTNGTSINNKEDIKLNEKNSAEEENKKTENEKDSNKEEKPTIGGQDLSTALLNKFGIGFGKYLSIFGETGKNASAKLNLENISQSILMEPGMLEQFEKLRESAHGLTDTFYVDNVGSGGDWKNNLTAEFIKEQKDQNEFNFVNNPSNIEKAIKLFGIDKKKNDKGEFLDRDKQEELAKEKLKTMAPYSAMGINDVATIKGLMDRNIKPDKALQTLYKDNEGTMNYNKFVDNQQNIQVMQTMEAEKMGKLAEFNAGNQTVIQQVNQQVQQTISDGIQYIKSGDAKDPETLNRLVELERKIDSKVSIEGSKHTSKTQYIVNIDKVIDKAVKKNIKSIKLPVNKSMPINATIKQKNEKAEASTKALEGAMNEVLRERRRQQTGAKTTRVVTPPNSPKTPKTNNTPPKKMPPGNPPKK